MFTKDITKEKITTIAGVVIMFYALSCYMFSFPYERDITVNILEFLFGIMLLFTDGKKIAEKVFGRFSKKLEE